MAAMSDQKDNAPKTLQLTRTVKTGKVQQTFSRGRSKTVAVEVKRTRTFSRDNSGTLVEEQRPDAGASAPEAHDAGALNLTPEERETRLRALEQAKSGGGVGSALYNAPLPVSEPAPPVIKRPKSDSDEPGADRIIRPAAPKPRDETAEDEFGGKREKRKPDDASKGRSTYNDKRQKGKLTIAHLMAEQEERMRSLASVKRARQKAKRQLMGGEQEHKKQVREVVIPESITVQELANRMAVRSHDVIKELMKLGIMSDINATLDADTAELIVNEFGHTFKRVTAADVEDVLKEEPVTDSDLQPRAPIVTVMGHVDHGKTSLLDALRSTNVTGKEAGGITQHIGAYQVKAPGGQPITFLDTPGHAAFTAMRARGAKVTDIVILVIAADDGIMPQTVEAIHHAKAAEVPIIVAVNKIDKPGADPKKAKEALLSHELVPEEFGGETIVVEVSAKQKLNLDKLLEAVLLQAEVLELKASRKQGAVGTVIEAKVDKGKGVLATLLVQRGTLRTGDIVVAGTGYGKAKAMLDEHGKTVQEAGPSVPVEILGLDELPGAGDNFAVVPSEKQAREIVEYRRKLQRDTATAQRAAAAASGGLERLFQTASGKELRVIVKADVQGSVEAIAGSLEKLSGDEVKVKIVHAGAGGITESDVTLAAAVGAVIFGFNVRAGGGVRELAQKEKIDLHYYSVIYDLLDDAAALVSGLTTPKTREVFLGNAAILQVFNITKVGKVAGCMVKEGSVKRGAGVRLIRDSVVIHEGKLKTLKRFKDEVAEVREGTECGMAFEHYEDIKPGDVIEAFETVVETPKVAASSRS